MSFIEKLLTVFMPWLSAKWVMWRAQDDYQTCVLCKELQGKIFSQEEFSTAVLWPLHSGCRCTLKPMDVLPAGYATQDGMEGADYSLAHTGKLPENYLTKQEAEKLGWKSKKGNLAEVAKGKVIGGNVYRNHDGRLPQASGRIWYEADINYTSGYRGTDRLFYSNDGLIFASYDHGATFYEISKQGE